MERSEQINELAGALAKVQAHLSSVLKDKEARVQTRAGGEYRYSYADLGSVWDAIRKPLTDNGLSIAQFPVTDERGVAVTTMLLHSSGQFLSSTLSMRPKGDTPQDIGSAITYIRRYALASMIGVSTDEDEDGNIASGHKAHTAPRQLAPASYQQPQPAAGMTVDEAKQRFYAKFGSVIAGDTWQAVQKYANTNAAEPTSVEGWLSAGRRMVTLMKVGCRLAGAW